MLLCNNLPEQYSEEIAKIANIWADNMKTYEAKYDSTDSIHWYLERTNIGALASAVWMGGGVAIEEYGSTKGNEEKYTGRNDLYFHIGDIKAVAEAKLVWVKTGYANGYQVMLTDLISDSIGPIDSAIEKAELDLSKVISEHEKFAVIFVNTYAKAEHSDNSMTLTIIEDHLKKIGAALIAKYSTLKSLKSSKGNICNHSYLIIAKR